MWCRQREQEAPQMLQLGGSQGLKQQCAEHDAVRPSLTGPQVTCQTMARMLSISDRRRLFQATTARRQTHPSTQTPPTTPHRPARLSA